MSADSVVPEPGNPQSLNRFAYVLGNPLRYVDPTGHFQNDAELARYLGFGSTEEMYNSDLWVLWSQDDAWMEMIRSTEFDFGSVLVWENGDMVSQVMLVECDGRLALWSWELPHPARIDKYSLNDVFSSSRWALFYNPDPTKGFEENYRLVSHSYGGASLPVLSFKIPGLVEDAWAGSPSSPTGGVRITVERKNDVVVGGLKIIGGTFTAAKGATMIVAGFVAAPETFGASLLAVTPGAFVFAGGLATFGSGIKDVVGEVTGMHAEYIKY